MSPGQCDAMVRPFARGDVARGGEGTGLGLAITKRAVAALAGQLSFRFVPDGFQASVLLTDLKVQACPNLG
jgi:two-component system, OmpR family, osmolarity sensor histidine kinase EnvZ